MQDVVPSYSAWLPANVRYDKTIPANAKLLFAELSCLSNVYGYSFATNKYFADLYDITEDRVSRLIHILEKSGYIRIELERNDNNFVTSRKIFIVQFDSSNVKNTDSGSEKYRSPSVKIPSPDVKKDKTNNNIINNKTINNNTTAEKKSVSKFAEADYAECRNLISEAQTYLSNKNIVIDTTTYPIPVMKKWLKNAFTLYGVENTKIGIKQSVNNNWLVSTAHYSLSALFSEKVFPKLISNSSSNHIEIKKNISAFNDNVVRDYSHDEGGW